MLLLTPHRTGVAVVLAAGLVLAGGRPVSAQKEFQIYYQMQASVIDVLEPVHTRQPADDEVARRLALAYLLTSRYADALSLLDGYTQRHAGDQEAAFGYVLAQYAVTSKAGVPLSGAEQAKVARLAKVYKGADQPLLSRYVAVLSAK